MSLSLTAANLRASIAARKAAPVQTPDFKLVTAQEEHRLAEVEEALKAEQKSVNNRTTQPSEK
jgi:hypothetical protein